eukprot:1142081-Prymnesium_polylepis.2
MKVGPRRIRWRLDASASSVMRQSPTPPACWSCSTRPGGHIDSARCWWRHAVSSWAPSADGGACDRSQASPMTAARALPSLCAPSD